LCLSVDHLSLCSNFRRHHCLMETMDKVRILNKLGTPDWNLDAIPLVRRWT
jgi:hypothetical protein